jgi:small GTP-binding protein
MKEGERCKILLLGESAVGKTSLFKQFVGDPHDRPTPTIGVEYKQKVMEGARGKLLKLQLWDTAGTERFRTITPIYYRNVDGVLLIFDITDRPSFTSIQYWVDELNEKGEDGAQLLLVGNKSDQQSRREVSQEEAAAKARQLGISYVEANSLNYEATKPPFDRLVELITQKRSREGGNSVRGKGADSGTITLREPQKRDKRDNECC